MKTDDPDSVPFLTSIKKAQDISGLSRHVLYGASRRGDLKVVRIGSRVMIDTKALLTWLNPLPAADVEASSSLPPDKCSVEEHADA
jgi:Helix-turn-helix domain